MQVYVNRRTHSTRDRKFTAKQDNVNGRIHSTRQKRTSDRRPNRGDIWIRAYREEMGGFRLECHGDQRTRLQTDTRYLR